jgi:uncharacterized membrane protein YqgA involved in biofilm formation
VSLIDSAFRSVDGTLLNAATVIVGTLLGLLIGNRLPERVQDTLFGAIGLVTLLIGVSGALTTRNPLIILGSMLLGGLLGELLRIEDGLKRLGDAIERRTARPGSSVSAAFVTSSLVFCVGPLSILGSLANGLNGNIDDLAIKAMLDGFAAIAFAATLGWGVLFSVFTILLYQGGISLAAQSLKPFVDANPAALVELNAVGGVILMALGLKLLKIRELRVANYLPALVIAPLLAVLVAHPPFHVPLPR